MTLVEFLLARITEDETTARAATDGPWRVDDERYAESIYSDGMPGVSVVAGGRWGDEASVFDSTEDALHIARHDPARVLAECEAKRRIVEAISEWLDRHPAEDHVPAGDDALAWLALPYADHPGYREEWKP